MSLIYKAEFKKWGLLPFDSVQERAEVSHRVAFPQIGLFEERGDKRSIPSSLRMNKIHIVQAIGWKQEWCGPG